MKVKNMSITAQRVLDKFPELLSFSTGSLAAVATQSCSSEQPTAGSIVYLPDPTHIAGCVETGCKIIVIPEKLSDQFADYQGDAAIITSKNLSVAMALVNQEFFPVPYQTKSFEAQDIHASAIIAGSAKLGVNCIVGPNVVIDENTVIGDHTILNANVVVEAGAKLGDHCHIQAQSFIGHHCELGESCVVKPNSTIGSDGYGLATDHTYTHHHKPHYGRVVLQDRVEIGAGVQIDRGAYGDTVIGEGTKMDNHCHIAHNVKVGKECLITAGFIVAGSSSIGDHCVFGGRVSVGDHIIITNNVQIAAMSVVTNNVTEPGNYAGYPLQNHKDALRSAVSLTHVPQMRKQLKAILAKLDLK